MDRTYSGPRSILSSQSVHGDHEGHRAVLCWPPPLPDVQAGPTAHNHPYRLCSSVSGAVTDFCNFSYVEFLIYFVENDLLIFWGLRLKIILNHFNNVFFFRFHDNQKK